MTHTPEQIAALVAAAEHANRFATSTGMHFPSLDAALAPFRPFRPDSDAEVIEAMAEAALMQFDYAKDLDTTMYKCMRAALAAYREWEKNHAS